MADLPPPQELQAVFVHAPALAPLGGEAAFSAVRIGPEVLEANARLDEALKTAPGVSLFRRTDSAAANPTTQGLSLRSIAPSGAGRALVTLDGAPQNDPFGGWVIWSALPPEGLDGATIVRGAGAGPYGAGALTGVVALQERAVASGLAVADLSAAERGGYRGVTVVGSETLLVTAQASHTDGYYAVRGPRRGAADRRLKMSDAALATRLQGEAGGVRVALRGSLFGTRQGAGLVGARSNATGASLQMTLARAAEQGVGGWRLQAWVRRSDLENSSVAVTADRAATTPANDQYATPATGYGVNAALQGQRGALAWELGADLRLARGTEHERFRAVNGAFTRDRSAGGKTLVGGVYSEAAYIRGPWTLTGGARVDRARSYDAERVEIDIATGAVTLASHAPDRSGVTPTGRIGMRYDGDGFYFRAAAYAGFRPPTLNELHRPFRVGNDVTEANPNLKPETLQGLEAGIGGRGRLRWDATLFWNRLKDPIANVTLVAGPATFPLAGVIPAGGTLRQRRNAGEIRAWGLEAEASADAGPMASWRLALNYADAEVRGGGSAPQLTGLRPAQTPRWTVTAGVEARPAARLSLEASLRYESRRFEDDLNTRRLSAGAEVNARADWRLSERVLVYLAVDNLLGEKLEVGETADGVESFAAPRIARLGFTYRR